MMGSGKSSFYPIILEDDDESETTRGNTVGELVRVGAVKRCSRTTFRR
jgi:hypothetical protein